MITAEVFEATKENPFKTIYYRDTDDISKFSLVLDEDNKLLSVNVSEYDKNGRIICTVVYAQDHHTKKGYREYDYDEHGQEIGYRDYHVINEQDKLLVRTRYVVVVKDKINHIVFYDENDKPFAFEVFENDKGCGFVTMGYFNMDGSDRFPPNIPFYKIHG